MSRKSAFYVSIVLLGIIFLSVHLEAILPVGKVYECDYPYLLMCLAWSRVFLYTPSKVKNV